MVSCPVVGITLGDPGGVGPEVALKALAELQGDTTFKPVLIGPKAVLQLPGMQALFEALSGVEWHDVSVEDEAFSISGTGASNGHAAYQSICQAVHLIEAGKMDRMVTAPISKTSLQQANVPFTGHTTLLAHLAGAENVSMGFYSEPLKTILATIHIPLAKVPESLTSERLVSTFKNAVLFSQMMGLDNPRIAVAGLNPHASEEGLFGSEEAAIVSPSINRFEMPFGTLTGPYPPDTLYHRAVAGEFDMVVSLYHDQGLIPLKLLAFDRAVNVSIGLPFIRTSPDHGTAFDIAYQDNASANSMIEAVRLAATLELPSGPAK